MVERFENFTVLLNRINRNIRKIKNQEMAEYNLRSAHVSCLYFIYRGDNITATELCEKTNMQKSLMNRTLNSMEKKGLIFRRRSEKDKRQVYVSMNMENAEVYERQHKNVLKVELPYKASEKDVLDIVEKIKVLSVQGYPYLLSKAHNDVVITDRNIKELLKLAKIYAKIQ